MSFDNCRIAPAEIAAHGIQSKPNKLPGPTTANKLAFDELVTEVVAEKYNALIDALQGAGAAGEIGVDTISGITASTVQEALAAINESARQASTGELYDGSVETRHLAQEAVTTAKIASMAVTTALLAAGAVTTAKIADGNVTTAKIAALAVTAALLADGAVTTDKLGALAVTTAKIANAAVDATKLAAGAVTAVKIADGNVTAAKIADLGVTTAKIAAAAVTKEKLDTTTLDYATVNLAAEQVVPIYIGTDTPTTATLPEGAVYIKYTEPEES
jgi:hypothetical protein